MAFEYEAYLRPNYEARAAAGWLAGMGLAAGGYLISSLPPAPFVWMGVTSGLMAMWRGPAAYKQWKKHKSIAGHDLAFMQLAALKKKVDKNPGKLWLGWGFNWEQRHAQIAHDILNMDHSKFLKHNEEKVGAPWIHGIEQSESDIVIPLAHLNAHMLLVGTTRSGKTRMFDSIITQAILRGEPVIIIDPKGDRDLKENAQRACEFLGQPERFVYFHPAFPEESVRLDPLHNFNRSTELATRIAAITPSESGNDPFKAFGQMALNNIVQGLLLTNRRPNLMLLRRYLEGGPEKLVVQAITAYCDEHMPDWMQDARPLLAKASTMEKRAAAMVKFYRDNVQEQCPSPDLEGLLSMWEHDRTHFGKMVATLLPVLNMLTSGTLGPLLSPDPSDADDERPITDMARVINNGQVLYIGLDSLSDNMVGSAIGSILLADLTAVAGDRYNYGVNNVPVNVFVDEAAEVINDPCIAMMNKGGGASFRMAVATQTFSDFEARTGSKAKALQVLGNLNNLLVLRVIDGDTQKYITDNLPPTRYRYVMRTHGTSASADNPLEHSGNQGERLMEEEADTFPAQLLGMIPDLQYIAKVSGGRIIKGRLPILTENK